MATSYSPKIPLQNLRVCVDGLNRKSYTGSGNIWTDISGNNLNLTSGNFISDGKGGYYLGSSSADVQTASTNALNTDFHTIVIIMRFTGDTGVTGGWEQFIGYYGSGTDRSPGIWRYPSNRRVHWTYNPGNTATNFGATGLGTDFPLNQDFLVIMRKDGPNTHFWIDATKFNGITSCANPKTAGDSVIRLYDYYTSDLMQIKYFAVYDTALTDIDCNNIAKALTPRLAKS